MKRGLDSNDICSHCIEERDSIGHKLFKSASSRIENRDNLFASLADDFRSAALFFQDKRIRTNFRKLVETNFGNSNYYYRDVLNRNYRPHIISWWFNSVSIFSRDSVAISRDIADHGYDVDFWVKR